MLNRKKAEGQLSEFYRTSFNYKDALDAHKEDYYKYYFELLKPENPDELFLDIGCGTGFAVLKLAKNGYKGAGIDISPLFILEAKKRLANVKMGGMLSLRYVMHALYLMKIINLPQLEPTRFSSIYIIQKM